MPDLVENSNNFPSTFSRASKQWTEKGGTLVEYGVDVPAFGDVGVSVQSAATNLITYSDDLSQAPWSATNCSASYTGASIVGRASTILTDSGSGGGYVQYDLTQSGWIAASVYLECDTGTVDVTLEISDDGANSETESITVTTTGSRYAVFSPASGWSTTRKLKIIINDASASIRANLVNYVSGDITVTDPIPTSGVAVTRAAGSLSYGVAGLPVNDIQGSFDVKLHLGGYISYFMPYYADSSNYFSIGIAETLLTVRKRVGGSNKNANQTLAAPLIPGNTYTVTWSLSSTTGVSATINGETASHADVADLAPAVSVCAQSNNSNIATADGGCEAANFTIEAL